MIWLLAPAIAACPSTPASLEAAMDEAQIAFSALDSERFRVATDRLTADIACLVQPITPTLAARLHRVVGLREFFAGREDAARQAFAAARAVDAAYVFPESLVPADHPVRALYESAAAVGGAITEVPHPADGRLAFDGTPSRKRPTERATIMTIEEQGGGLEGAYLWPEDPLLAYTPEILPAVGQVAAPIEPERRGPNVPLAIAAGASVLASGATFFVARASHDAFVDLSTPEEDVRGLATMTNTMQATSIGLGVVALGAGVGAVIAGEW